MSKIGKINILIPDKVKVILSGSDINIEGPHGKQSIKINLDIFDLDEAVPLTTEFMVVNVTNGTELDTVVPWSSDLDGDLGQFDGMVLEISNQKNISVDSDLSHFYPESESDYDFTFSPFSFGGIATQGVAYPRNYGLVFSDSAIFSTNSVNLVRENGQSITIDSSMANFKVIDLDDQELNIDMAIIDRTWTYYSKAPGLSLIHI